MASRRLIRTEAHGEHRDDGHIDHGKVPTLKECDHEGAAHEVNAGWRVRDLWTIENCAGGAGSGGITIGGLSRGSTRRRKSGTYGRTRLSGARGLHLKKT